MFCASHFDHFLLKNISVLCNVLRTRAYYRGSVHLVNSGLLWCQFAGLLAAYPWFDPLERFTETWSLFSLTSMRIFNMYKVLQVYLDEQIIEICSKSQLISFFLENLLFHFSKKRWEIEDTVQIKIGNDVIIGEKFVANSLYIQYSWFDEYQGIHFHFILE